MYNKIILTINIAVFIAQNKKYNFGLIMFVLLVNTNLN